MDQRDFISTDRIISGELKLVRNNGHKAEVMRRLIPDVITLKHPHTLIDYFVNAAGDNHNFDAAVLAEFYEVLRPFAEKHLAIFCHAYKVLPCVARRLESLHVLMPPLIHVYHLFIPRASWILLDGIVVFVECGCLIMDVLRCALVHDQGFET